MFTKTKAFSSCYTYRKEYFYFSGSDFVFVIFSSHQRNIILHNIGFGTQGALQNVYLYTWTFSHFVILYCKYQLLWAMAI